MPYPGWKIKKNRNGLKTSYECEILLKRTRSRKKGCMEHKKGIRAHVGYIMNLLLLVRRDDQCLKQEPMSTKLM